ncbi:MAG: dTDP-4-dehydrorhamnose reductase [Planctomycetaceae bacterium]
MTRRIAIAGSTGQLGTALQAVLSGDVIPLSREQLDIADADSIAKTLADISPDIVINAAAYNFVDKAEAEPEIAFRANALGPRNLAMFCAERDLPLVHISSDYVFSQRAPFRGTASQYKPFTEEELPDPRSAYAVSKLAGEQFVRQHHQRHFIFRTCGLYGSVKGLRTGNFVATMLRLAGERDKLRVVDDQHCTPTFVMDLAQWIAELIETDQYGVFHATNAGETTWYDFAREIFRLANVELDVVPITSAEYGAVAPRPGYSVLDCTKLNRVLKSPTRSWQEALADHLQREQISGD